MSLCVLFLFVSNSVVIHVLWKKKTPANFQTSKHSKYCISKHKIEIPSNCSLWISSSTRGRCCCGSCLRRVATRSNSGWSSGWDGGCGGGTSGLCRLGGCGGGFEGGSSTGSGGGFGLSGGFVGGCTADAEAATGEQGGMQEYAWSILRYKRYHINI